MDRAVRSSIEETVFLDASSVIADPSDVDKLFGGLNQDWFFADADETLDFVSSGPSADKRS